MELSYNVSFSLAALLISIVLILIISLKYSDSNVMNKRFKYFIVASISMIALDLITVITNDYSTQIPKWVNYLLNSLYFFSGACVGLLFLHYIVSIALIGISKRNQRISYIVNGCVAVAYAILLFVNCFAGFFFNFEDGTYTHGAIYLFVNTPSIAFVIEGFVLVIINRKKFKTSQVVATTLFIVIFFASFLT